MKKERFFATIIMILCMGTGIVFAGGSGQSSGGTPVASGPVNVTYPITTEGAKSLTFWLPIQPPAARHINNYSDQEIFQIISKNTGINMTYYHPAVGQEQEQLNILVASGDLPDIIQIRGLYSGGSSVGVSDGIFRDLTNLIRTHAPDYLREITKTEINYRLATDNEGRITEFQIIKQSAPAFNRMNYRQDVMDQLGLKIPVTIADLESDFAKMKTAGLTAFMPQANGKIDLLMWVYGTTPGFFIGTDGNIKWGEAEPGYRQYLELMNKWDNSGYISPDFMSNLNDVERRSMFTTNTVSMIIQPVDLVKSAADAVGIKIVPLPYPRLTAGQQIHFQPVSFETRPLLNESMATVITTSCKNPEIAAEYLNYYYTPEGADLANWGIKDYTYTVDASGKKTFTDNMLRNPKIPLADIQTMLKIHLIAKLSEADVVCNPNVVINEEALELRMRYSDDKTIDDSQILPAFAMSLKDNQSRNEIMRDINTYVNEMTLKFITGVTPLSDFDSYIAQIKKMNLDEAIRLTQAGYTQFKNKPGYSR